MHNYNPVAVPVYSPPDALKRSAARLRKAFMDTTKDPEYIADAAKSKLELSPLGGETSRKRCWKSTARNRMRLPS